MKRTGFIQRTPQIKPTGRQWEGDAMPSQKPRVELRINDGKARATITLPKRAYLRSEPYRRWVATNDCAHCGRGGRSQAAHSDAGRDGKGLGLKADDSMLWPGCADEPGRVGCHTLLCSTGKFKREHSQALADSHIEQTQRKAIAAGVWPKTWPMPGWYVAQTRAELEGEHA